MVKKVLVVLTSASEMKNKNGNAKPTGWFLPEFAHPYDEFAKAGYELTVVSPKGGESKLDPASIEMFKSDPSSTSFLNNQKDLWEKTKKLSDYVDKASEFDAVFYPGGHGPMLDLAVDAESQKLIANFFEAGKPVAAVCHAPIVLADVKLSTGEYLVKGKTVTGFTNKEEEIMQLVDYMPFLLEDKVKASGASFVKADEPWGEKVVVDGKLITGQNPASAKALGEALVKVLG
ncbi:ThiJ/PfpI family protein [Pyricularia oryzae 70-15]|uniref:D-lactate dehydratase n=4 Tax=Pyricularia oryzae TaxID=318829 RepID=G4MUT0_PYRO7|nr:ThiJ/PfpI family protein [Pyricularia oryzae 70-15]ADD84579.1 conserved hypothetical protein [Pyricularia oryzae]ELQ43532.1 ThiJ/PfpI family protein [Pyricularia oryzae Y34]EHA54860.1 ThiJ/PfpI family protein [Pyricularia oryzae 70-15]KAI7919864.1 ThiJ/PfpI family protein [Pyricularia oryzae]KAI7926934.1 ThiJ/PfpI family protein [Pyricularia oryzae]